MKRLKLLAACAIILLCSMLLLGCGLFSDTVKTVYELPYYSGTDKSELSDYSKYNDSLWRRNTDTVSGADPQVFDNTDVDGYYYLYYTSGSAGFSAYRTKDFSSWESVGVILERETGWTAYWAPELTSETNPDGSITYFLSFSAIPTELQSKSAHVMFLAVSDSPAGPFKMVDFTDKDLFGENARKDKYLNSYSKYALFDYEVICDVLNNQLDEDYDLSDIPTLIDSHPYIDSNGDKYMYFSLEDPRCIVGMKMNDWYSVDYSTVTVLTRVGYYTIEDYNKAQAGESVERAEYELIGAEVNEGPAMIEHNGKYYLTFSVNGFYDASYSVMQAVSDSPLGPFRKLSDDENGLFLSADIGGNAMLSGTGHHSFITIGDKLFICYHRHTVNGTINGGRMICLDELRWVETTDEVGNKLDVLYANGPTITVQPRFDSEAEYVNIAEEGKVSLVSGSLTSDSSTDSLNDGLLSYNTTVSQGFLDKYVRETTSIGEATYEISFDTAKEIRGFMVYGSKYMDNYFAGIYNIEITAIENGVEKIYYIKELNIDESCVIYNEDELLYGNYIIENIVYGSGVYAEFGALNVKSIRFTTKASDGQEKIGLSEIAVLGKRS